VKEKMINKLLIFTMNNKLIKSIIFVLFVITSCSGLCDNKILKKIESPSGKFIVYVFIRDCGATTDFSPQIAIFKKDFFGKFPELKNKGGNVFVGNHSKYIDAQWIDQSTLLIKHNCKSGNIYKKVGSIYGLTITYEYFDFSLKREGDK